MPKLILKEAGKDDKGNRKFVSVSGHPYILKDGVIHSSVMGELHALSGDNGRPITERNIQICD